MNDATFVESEHIAPFMHGNDRHDDDVHVYESTPCVHVSPIRQVGTHALVGVRLAVAGREAGRAVLTVLTVLFRLAVAGARGVGARGCGANRAWRRRALINVWLYTRV